MARIVALAPDLFFASKIEATLRMAGHEVVIARSEEELVDGIARPALDRAQLLIADLGEVDPEGLAGHDVPTLGFCSHLDEETRRRAEKAGFDQVVPRSRMAREMRQLVEGLTG
jgi:hypothetical protein